MSEKSGFENVMAQVDGIIFHPLTLGFVGFAVLCAVIVFGMNNAKVDKSNMFKFSQTWWLNAIGWFAVCFTPIWVALLLCVLTMLALVGWPILSGETVQKITTPEGTIKNGADNLRWYVLAFVGLLTALAGIIGTPLTLIRVWTTERQTNATEQGLITDRINKAVEGLGAEKNVKRQRRNQSGELQYDYLGDEKTLDSDGKRKLDYKKPIYEEITVPNLEVRVGAIYSLERIAQDSLRDHVQIMEILCTYIRQNSPARTSINIVRTKADNFQATLSSIDIPNLRTDVATALNVIGRRSSSQKETETLHRRGLFSLHGCNLQRIEGRDLDFSGIDFSGSWLSFSLLHDCDFRNCHFENSTLDGGAMIRCNLDNVEAKGAIFSGRTLPGTTFRGAYLFDASFNDCEILENINHGSKTDFSYACIVDANFGSVLGFDNLQKNNLILGNERPKAGIKGEQSTDPTYEYRIRDNWKTFKESHGYTSKKNHP